MRRMKIENENNFEGVYSENVLTMMNESMVKINPFEMKLSIESQVYCENEKIDCSLSVKFLNPLSVSNYWVGRVSVTSMTARSESVLSADNCPINTPLTSPVTPPCLGIGESSQHQGWGTPYPCHTDLGLLEATLSHSLLCRDVASVGIHSEFPIIGPRHSHTHPINNVLANVDPLDIKGVINTLIGDSNSPMPSPVGGILDTPIVTFLSRIPVDLSLWININVNLCTLASSIAIRARCAGGLLQQHTPPSRPDSNPLNHDKLPGEVIDIVFEDQLITSLTPLMLISCSDLFIFKLIQVLSWTCLTKYHLIQICQDSSEKTS